MHTGTGVSVEASVVAFYSAASFPPNYLEQADNGSILVEVSPTDINGDASAIGVATGIGLTGLIKQNPRVTLSRQHAIESCSRRVRVGYASQKE
jgi:hypothetical protein